MLMQKRVAGGGGAILKLLKWVFIGLVVWFIFKSVRQDTENFESGGSTTEESFDAKPIDTTSSLTTSTCSGDPKKPGGCISATGGKLLPVLDAGFNMREISKNCALLEEHLNQKSKRCEDCIKKHFLILEGLAEEAISLDSKNEYKISEMDLPDKLRKIQKEYIASKDAEKVAQELRQIRKPLMEKFYHHF
jgi:hypothetical protein